MLVGGGGIASTASPLVVVLQTQPAEGARVTFTFGAGNEVVDAQPPYAIVWTPPPGSPEEVVVEAAVAWTDGWEPATTALRARVRVDEVPPLLDVAIGLEPSSGGRRVEVATSVDDPVGVYGAYVELLGAGTRSTAWLDGGGEFAFEVPSWAAGQYEVVVSGFDRAGNTSTVRQRVLVCREEEVACGSRCVPSSSLAADALNCGGCGIECSAGEVCEVGRCVCAAGLELCDGVCTAVAEDAAHCGGCGRACDGSGACFGGVCAPSALPPMIRVEPATYVIGSPVTEFFREFTEGQHEVRITRPFELGAVEVTQGQWLDQFEVNPSLNWACGDRCPVDNVTWYEAVAYANAVSSAAGLPECYRLDGCGSRPIGGGVVCSTVSVLTDSGNPLDCAGYRLPTEAEWELAYRAGTTTAFYVGDFASLACADLAPLIETAWFSCNSGGVTHPVATLAPNPLGFYDLAGNVFEWTGDSWRSEVPPEPEVDPVGGFTIPDKTVKGGDVGERSNRLRAATRLSANAFGAYPPLLGFRLARTVGESR
ncbi:MAG: SUMF1/EgtB/PvdO family nonheme iron enzyme [Myxococcales bacterium]|nr:SUMF1/EgtB/PvdO family nonheme iron enzyme [Myxococcales bacterium]